MKISLLEAYKCFILNFIYILIPVFSIAQGNFISENGTDFKNDCFQTNTINLVNGTNTILGRVGGQELPNNIDPADYINFFLPTGGTIEWITIATSNGMPTVRSFLALWDGVDCAPDVTYSNIENSNTVLFSNISTSGTLTLRGVDVEFDYRLTIMVTGLNPGACDCQIPLQASWINDLTPSASLFPNQLIDEQMTLPICRAGGQPSTTWGNDFIGDNGIPPAIIELNFPQWYLLNSLHLFDDAGIGFFRIEYLDENNSWQLLSDYHTDKYQEWVTISNLDISTSTLRLTQLDNGANIAEIGICGQPIVAACTADLMIDSVLTTSAIYQADQITSSSVIYPDNNIQYKAATSITLKPGFHARIGTEFLAKIEPCTINLQASEGAIAARTNTPIINYQLPLVGASSTLKAYPNPFESTLQIEYYLPTKRQVSLTLMDQLGRVAQTIISSTWQEEGRYQQYLDADKIEAGTYFLLFKDEEQVITKKVVLLE